MAGVLLTKLSIIVTPHTVHCCALVLDLLVILSDHDWVIVAATHIDHLSLFEGWKIGGGGEIGLGSVSKLAVVIVAAGVEFAVDGDES